MSVINEQPFAGAKYGVVTAIITGSATLEAKGADGTWVQVPDGSVSNTVFSFHAPFGSIFRFTGMTGTAAIFS